MLLTNKAAEKYIRASITKAKMPMLKMLLLSFTAGMFISFAGAAATVAAATIENASVCRLIMALVFPAGLTMVILNFSELFTGNNLMIMSLADKKIKLLHMLRNWAVVYIGNFLGSIFVTYMFTVSNVYRLLGNGFAIKTLETAVMKCNMEFNDAFIKGILCNILVCVAVIMTIMAETAAGKIIALFMPIMVFVILGFEHSVANMSYVSGGLFINSTYGDLGVDVRGLTWFNFIFKNLLPVTLGNMVGGVGSGLIYWYTSIKTGKHE